MPGSLCDERLRNDDRFGSPRHCYPYGRLYLLSNVIPVKVPSSINDQLTNVEWHIRRSSLLEYMVCTFPGHWMVMNGVMTVE